jgi:hypothetical protein
LSYALKGAVTAFAHNDLTAQIVTLKTQVNAMVHAAFKLNTDKIVLIEEAAKDPYGTV